MNGMNLSGKPGIVHAMQIPPTFGQPPIPFTQPRIGHVALDDRALAAELDEAARVVAVLGREVALLRVARPVAALAHGPPEEPFRPQLLVELRRRRQAAEVQHEVEQHLGHVVRLRRAPRDADDREAGRGPEVPAEVVGQAHRAGRVVLHRGDAAVGGARPDRDHGRGLRREPVDPFVGRDRLAVLRVDADPGPVPVAVDLLVRDGALEDQDERVELAGLGVVPGLEELGPVLVGEHRRVDDHAGHAGDDPEDDVLERRVRRRGHRHGVPVTALARGHPDHMGGDGLLLVLARRELNGPHRSSSQGVNRSAATDRPRAGPSPACPRTPSPPAPSPAAPSAPRRSPRRPRRPAPPRMAPRAASAASGATAATSTPSFATYMGSMPRISAAPRTAGADRHVALAHDHRHARRPRQLVQHRRDAARGWRRAGSAARARRPPASRRPSARASACPTRSPRRARTRRARA